MERKKILEQILPYVKKGSPDRYRHSLRVLALAEKLAKKEKADLKVVRFAALLHDLGKEQGNECHALRGAKIAQPILKRFNLTEEQKQNILHCIACHGTFQQKSLKTIEAKVVSDADKLDRIGAVRIALYFYCGLLKKRELLEIKEHLKFISKKTTRLFTESGKTLGKEKMKFYKEFIHRFEEEWVE